ncbi:hypothetical protein GCM10018953_44460 [Streptosporangium nondiastaticum]
MRACAPRMSDGWREGFLAGLAAQRAALLRAAPAAGDYPPFGRDRFGRYLFDLVEPCAGVEAPAAVRRSPHWAGGRRSSSARRWSGAAPPPTRCGGSR